MRAIIKPTACALAATLTANTVCAQVEPTFARIQPGNVVEILNLGSGTWREVYRSPHWNTTDLTVGPDGKLLAFLAWTEGTVVGHDYAKPPSSELLIIDRDGRLDSAVVRNVQKYAWCGPSCVVYILGQYEESHVGFRPEGVGMLDLTSGQQISLPSPPTPIGIVWASFDSAAYVKNWSRADEAAIYRLDLIARSMKPTALKDHLFSPTGRYYAHKPDLTDTLVVYETQTNSPMDLSTLRRESVPLGWGSAREDLLLAVRRPRRREEAQSGQPPRPKPSEAALRPKVCINSTTCVLGVSGRPIPASSVVGRDQITSA